MILIVSETQDGSTYKVIHWLDSLSKKWICITEQDNIEFIFSGKEIILQIKQMNINLSDISSFWYRRGAFSINNRLFTNIKEFDKLQTLELNNLIEFIYYKLKKIKHLNSIFNADVNK